MYKKKHQTENAGKICYKKVRKEVEIIIRKNNVYMRVRDIINM